MTTRDTVRDRATMFGWAISSTTFHGTNYVRGDKCIQVDYSSTGHITEAKRYRFFTMNDLQLEEHARNRNKKAEVLAWLAS